MNSSQRKIHYGFLYLITLLLKKTEVFSSLSMHLVYYSRKYPFPLHPKHLLPEGKQWYLNYLLKEDNVLDIGCHHGQHALGAARRVRHVTAFDINIDALNQARKDATKRKIKNISFLTHDANKPFPFRSREFDNVFFFAVLEHLINRKGALFEVRRVLKKEGRLFLSVPNRNTLWKRWQRKVGINSVSDPDHKVEFTRGSIIRLLSQCGYTVLNIEPVGLDLPGIGLIDLIGGISLPAYQFLSSLRRRLVQRWPSETVAFQVIAKK